MDYTVTIENNPEYDWAGDSPNGGLITFIKVIRAAMGAGLQQAKVVADAFQDKQSSCTLDVSRCDKALVKTLGFTVTVNRHPLTKSKRYLLWAAKTAVEADRYALAADIMAVCAKHFSEEGE